MKLPPPRLAQHWPFLPALIAPLVLLAPFVLGQQMLYWGTPLLQFYPWRHFAVESFGRGEIPLWNPLLGNGAPLLANYQSAVLYPPNWIMLFLPVELASSWLAAFHLILAGAGMVALARSLGLQSLGQAVAGLTFGLSQYLVARVGFFSINAAVAWLPWIVWATERVWAESEGQKAEGRRQDSGVQSPKSKASFPASIFNYQLPIANCQSSLTTHQFLALFLALQLLSGHAQITWYTLLLMGAWSGWRAWGAGWGAWKNSVKTLGALALVGALALGLAAIQLLPTAELLRESPRATAADYEFVMTYSFSPWRLLTFLAPDVLGNPAHGQFYGYGNYWEDAVYLGVLPFLLALSAALTAWRENALARFLAPILASAVLLALGRHTPIFPFLYRYIPTFNLFQAPTRMMVLAVFALALLAGIGVERWQAPQGRALYWTRLGAAGAVSVILISLGGLWFTRATTTTLGAQLHTVAAAIALMGVGLLLSALLSLTHTPKPAWAAAVILFIALDLLFFNYPLNPGAPLAAPTRNINAPRDQRVFQFPDDEYTLKYKRYLSFKTFGPPAFAAAQRADLIANAAMLNGLASANNFDPLLSARYAGLMDILSATRSTKLLNLMNVGIVVSAESLDWDVVGRGNATTFYRVPGQSRRVWVYTAARTLADAEAVRVALADPAFDPLSTLLLEADDPAPRVPAPRPTPPAPTTVNAFTITVALPQDGWALLADTHYPGWFAWVDGQPAPILHGQYAFRAVPVPAGEHQITFAYQPLSFTLGAGISSISSLLVIGWVIRTSKVRSPISTIISLNHQ